MMMKKKTTHRGIQRMITPMKNQRGEKKKKKGSCCKMISKNIPLKKSKVENGIPLLKKE